MVRKELERRQSEVLMALPRTSQGKLGAVHCKIVRVASMDPGLSVKCLANA